MKVSHNTILKGVIVLLVTWLVVVTTLYENQLNKNQMLEHWERVAQKTQLRRQHAVRRDQYVVPVDGQRLGQPPLSRSVSLELRDDEDIEFDQMVLQAESAKSSNEVVESLEASVRSSSRCSRPPGPILSDRWTQQQRKSRLRSLAVDNPTSFAGLEESIVRNGGTFLSLDDSLCSRPPHPFNEAKCREDYRAGLDTNGNPRAPPFSAYLFHDVCVSMNLDSSKQAQRGVLVFDPTNDSRNRCVGCPNPQMFHYWTTTACGMMWTHQINYKDFQDVNLCYQSRRKVIARNGQRQDIGETPIVGAVYFPGRTLHMQYTRNNPGHQLWDSLLSLAPILMAPRSAGGEPLFDKTITLQTPDCPSDVWICDLLDKLGVFKSGVATQNNRIPVFPGIMNCFEELIVPIQGWNHDNDALPPEILRGFREQLWNAYGMDPAQATGQNRLSKFGHVAKTKVLLYGHLTPGEAGIRRAWKNVDQVYHDMANHHGYDPRLVGEFGDLAVSQQAQAFFEADLIVMSHGGQFGNTVFARPGTTVVEITCNRYSHLGLNNFAFPKTLGINHIVLAPCRCESRDDYSNFEVGFAELETVLELMLAMQSEHPITASISISKSCDILHRRAGLNP